MLTVDSEGGEGGGQAKKLVNLAAFNEASEQNLQPHPWDAS
jgi:hypothetical protein